jgi:hypothetical protein
MIVASSPVWLGQAGLHVFGPQRRRLERVYGSVGPTREEGKNCCVACLPFLSVHRRPDFGSIQNRIPSPRNGLEIAFERSILGWLRFERQRALMNSMFPDGSGRCVILGGCVPRRERVRVPTF